MAKNTIVLKCADNQEDEKLAANALIMPGMILERTADDEVQPHSTADGPCTAMVANEDELQGKSIDDLYEEGEPVKIRKLGAGDVFYGFLANGMTAVIGTKLTSNGDGTLRLYTANSGGEVSSAILATALEAVDMSDSSEADPSGRIIVEVD
jgi:hypothetical protein